MADDVYLGDGVEATWDGVYLVLKVWRGDRRESVYLDASTWAALMSYARTVGLEPPVLRRA